MFCSYRDFNITIKVKLEHFKSTTVVPNSSLKEPESIYQYYMGQEGGGLFYETFEEQMNVKYMNVYSLSVILFFRSSLKRRLRAIEAETKQLMSAQPKAHQAVCMVVVERWSRK